ncbi:MAG: iron dependent repressor, metal binding and dimerization domain protein [Bacillota bacterium]
MKSYDGFYTVRGYQLLEHEKKLLTPAMEDYLEMIYRRSLEKESLRVNEIAELLNVQASSATKMIQRLAVIGLIDYEKYGYILLTARGREIGAFLLKRHAIVEQCLKNLGIRDTLLVDTELVEHHISMGALQNLEKLNLFFEKHPEAYRKFAEFEVEHPFHCP